MSDLSDLFEMLGGPVSIEKETGISANHIRQMKLRSSVPVKYWPAFMELASKLGKPLTEADLLRLHVPAPENERTGAAA